MMRRILLASALGAGLALVVGIVLFAQLEQRFVFFPEREIIYTPAQVGVVYEDIYFTTEDGVTLNGWYVPGDSEITWFWFHGNGGNISHRTEELALFHHRLGVNLFIFDYRGYGRSEGAPSIAGTHRDARAALAYLQNRQDVDPQKIVYFGRSLGAAVAVELAVQQPPLALTLVSPFASLSDMARIAFPYLPLHQLARGKYDTLSHTRQVSRPLLILHGEQDDIVPIDQGRKLFEAANDPKQFQTLPAAAHNDTYINGGEAYWNTLEQFVASLHDAAGVEP